MFDRFDDGPRRALGAARQEAGRLGHDAIGTEHILLGLVSVRSHVVGRVWARFGLDDAKVRRVVEGMVEPGPRSLTVPGQMPFTPAAKEVLEKTLAEAVALGHTRIAPGHLLLGLIAERNGGGARALQALGVEADVVRAEVRRQGTAADVEGARGPDVPPVDQRVLFSRLTDRARDALQAAREEALRRNHETVGTGHLLLGLASGSAGVAVESLRRADVDPTKARSAIDRLVAAGEPRRDVALMLFESAAIRALEASFGEADRRRSPRIGTGYLLLGVVADVGCTAALALRELGVTLDHVRAEVVARLALAADD